eukprot:1047809-Heterocapsa_arctica.AAC.1
MEARARSGGKGAGSGPEPLEGAGSEPGPDRNNGRSTERASGSTDRMNFGEEEGAGNGPANIRGPEGKGGGGGTTPPVLTKTESISEHSEEKSRGARERTIWIP